MTLAIFDLGKVCVFMAFPHPESQLPGRWLPSQGVRGLPGFLREVTGLADLVFKGSPGRKAQAVFLGKPSSILCLLRGEAPRPETPAVTCTAPPACPPSYY